jgi:UDP-N-acetylglucosamine--N-acetylmuramyl-(pentapeptide) pyrophosphoryl-undecaprenol N-acetylglucosamine transferase
VRKVLYGISPIGLGHATRSLVVLEHLRREGVDVKLFSGGKAADFIQTLGNPVVDIVDDAVPRIVNGEMKWSGLWYVRSWLALRRTIRRTELLFDSYKPDLVVGDEEFSGMAVAERNGSKRVFISDELMLGFGRTWLSRKIEERVDRWYNKLQGSVDLLIVPEFGMDSGNTKYSGPVVRPTTMTPRETREKYGLPEGKMILFSMSGSGIGGYLLKKALYVIRTGAIPGAFLAITGNRGQVVRESNVFDLGIVNDNQNVISAADLVVSTAGKSTIDEAAAAGTPIITIPMKNHAEQERNARALGYSYESLAGLSDLMMQKIGKREPPQEFRGGETISRLLLAML